MITLLLALAALSQDGAQADDAGSGWSPPPPPALVPMPRNVGPRFAPFTLTDSPRVVVTDPSLRRLAPVLQDLAQRLTGRPFEIAELPAGPGDFVLNLGYLPEEIAQHPEGYGIEVFSDHVWLSGATPEGLSRGIARLVQLFQYDAESDSWSLPPVEISDAPMYAWRGLMLDLARFPHPVESVEAAIELAYLFSLNTVHLHLSDNQAFTFPTAILPPRTAAGEAGRDRGYTPAEIERLVRFAHDRAITLVPEIDLPAHSAALVNARPDLFGTEVPGGAGRGTGEWRSLGLVNMVSPRAYDALDALLAEVVEAFPYSPYVHLGGDEVWAPGLVELPEFAAFAEANDIPTSLDAGAINALLNHFLVRTSRRVLELERQPIVWEGFRPVGGTEAERARTVPSDVIVMSWSQDSQDPGALLRAGHSIINCGWDPLYVVPAQGWAASKEAAYDWSPHEVRQRYGGRVTRLGDAPGLLGAQLNLWEQRPEAVLPSLMTVLPEIAERMWGNSQSPAGHGDFPWRQAVTTVDRLLRPVAITARATEDGRPHGVGTAFEGEIDVELATRGSARGTIRYVLSDDFGASVTSTSAAADGAIRLDRSTVVTAALFSDAGEPIGAPTAVRYEAGEPIWRVDAFRGAERSDDMDASSPDWIGAGVLLRPTPARVAAINRELFARVQPEAHVDTRVLSWTAIGEAVPIDPDRPRLWGQHRILAAGQIDVPESGEWTITMRSNDGSTALEIGGADALESRGGERVSVTGTLSAGTYGIRFDHAVTGVHNELQVWLDGPGGRARVPLVDLIRGVGDSLPPDELLTLDGFGPR